jgi:hypothetical protein
MKKLGVLILAVALVGGCAVKPKHQATSSEVLEASAEKKTPETVKAPKNASVVVGDKELALLDNMTKAVEDYVLKNEKKKFTSLCKEKRFDCFVDEKLFPGGKKKVTRTVPPYASGSKMGLQGEKRIQVRYDFYP